VVVLADDLIWATRLDHLVGEAGGQTIRARDLPGLERALRDLPSAVVIDLTSRAYDGITAIRLSAQAGAAVAAACQHDDRELRARARAAGASLVQPYARLHADGCAIIERWLVGLERGPEGKAR
jgi:hypothetical protein